MQLDYDGDGVAEMEVELTGVDNTTLTTQHILLNGNDMNNTGDDIITGTDGDDVLVGGYGSDTINGGNGNDLIYPDSKRDEYCWYEAGKRLVGC